MPRQGPKKPGGLYFESLSQIAELCIVMGEERKFARLVSRMSSTKGSIIDIMINNYKCTKRNKPTIRRKKKNEWVIDSTIRQDTSKKDMHKNKNAKTAHAHKRQENKSKEKTAKTGGRDNVKNSNTKKQKCVFCMPASKLNTPRCPLCNVFDDVHDKELFAKHLSDYHNVDLSGNSKKTSKGEEKNFKGKKRASHENKDGQIQADREARPQRHNFQVPYEESPGCAEPKAVLYRFTEIPTDGNCFFHSIIKILELSIPPWEIRKRLLASPVVDSCIDPEDARTILSSHNDYVEMDCIHIFTKVFDKNLCIHNHYVDSNTKEEVIKYVHFRVNTSQSFLHLHLQSTHYTPFIEISFY